jgi:hypothetical protein
MDVCWNLKLKLWRNCLCLLANKFLKFRGRNFFLRGVECNISKIFFKPKGNLDILVVKYFFYGKIMEFSTHFPHKYLSSLSLPRSSLPSPNLHHNFSKNSINATCNQTNTTLDVFGTLDKL